MSDLFAYPFLAFTLLQSSFILSLDLFWCVCDIICRKVQTVLSILAHCLGKSSCLSLFTLLDYFLHLQNLKLAPGKDLSCLTFTGYWLFLPLVFWYVSVWLCYMKKTAAIKYKVKASRYICTHLKWFTVPASMAALFWSDSVEAYPLSPALHTFLLSKHYERLPHWWEKSVQSKMGFNNTKTFQNKL